MTNSIFEHALLNIISKRKNIGQSEKAYCDRIVEYANLLHQVHGGDIDLIIAVLIVVNTYASNFDGLVLDQNAMEVQELLESVNYPGNKISLVLNQSIAFTTDNYNLDTTEEKIIHDVILLGKFGALGIARNIIAAEKTNTSFLEITLEGNKGINKLVYPESVLTAEKEIKLSDFLVGLFRQEYIIQRSYPGKYIILEGNSGVGKNTQAKFLESELLKRGKKTVVIDEPSIVFRDLENYWKNKYGTEMIEDKPKLRLYSIIGDRMDQIHDKVLKGLQEGSCIISIRSFISTLVYLCDNEFERLKMNYIHQFVPRPNVVIMYDTDEETSLRRIVKRSDVGRSFDRITALQKYRPVFLEVAKSEYLNFPVVVVDATGPIEQVALNTINIVEKYLE